MRGNMNMDATPINYTWKVFHSTGLSEPLMENIHKPNFMTDNDLCSLLVQASGGFILVVDCEQGEVVYVTESVEEILNITQADLLHNDFFNFLHSCDVGKVKNQLLTLSSSDVTIKMVVKDFSSDKVCPGARRSFVCRMKKGVKKSSGYGDKSTNIELLDESNVLMSFEGYLKCLPPTSQKKQNNEPSDRCCLVVICRPVKVHDQQTDYSEPGQMHTCEGRHRADGMFSRVDKGFVQIIGYYPDELIGQSPYNMFHKDDLHAIASHHQRCLNETGFKQEIIYRVQAKAGHYVPMRSTTNVFRNPWSNEVDFIVAKHHVMTPILPSLLFINEKRRLEKEAEGSKSSAASSSDQCGLTEDMEDLLRKMTSLDSKEGKTRKRGVGLPDDTKRGNRKNYPEYIGVMIAEQAAKGCGKVVENNARMAQYAKLLADETRSPPAPTSLQDGYPHWETRHSTTDSSHGSGQSVLTHNELAQSELAQCEHAQSDLVESEHAQRDLAQCEHPQIDIVESGHAQRDLAQYDLVESELTHNELAHCGHAQSDLEAQMKEIRRLIDAMDDIATSNEDEVNEISEEEMIQSVLGDIPWIAL